MQRKTIDMLSFRELKDYSEVITKLKIATQLLDEAADIMYRNMFGEYEETTGSRIENYAKMVKRINEDIDWYLDREVDE